MLGLGVIVGETLGVAVEMNIADEATGLAVLLHPHPHFGGNRFHPFIDGLFRRLPDVAVTAIRFDFASAEPPAARQEVVAALDQASARWTELPVFLVGYSFGAGIAAEIADRRIAGWYLLAPPTAMLSGATIGGDPRPKAIVVPEHDQFSPPASIAHAVAEWAGTTVTTLPDADHFLGRTGAVEDDALHWIEGMTPGGSTSSAAERARTPS
jgi:alpha/beta superfamily hydrolase